MVARVTFRKEALQSPAGKRKLLFVSHDSRLGEMFDRRIVLSEINKGGRRTDQ